MVSETFAYTAVIMLAIAACAVPVYVIFFSQIDRWMQKMLAKMKHKRATA